MTGRAEQIAAALAEAMHNLGDQALYWGDDGEGGEHFIEWPVAALSEHLATALAAQEGGRGGADTTTAAVIVEPDNHHNALACPYCFPVGALANVKADAWDEGFKQGGPMHDEHHGDPDAHTRNPYRADRVEGNQP